MVVNPKETSNSTPSPNKPPIKMAPELRNKKKTSIIRLLLGATAVLGLVFFAIVAGALTGYQSGNQSQRATSTILSKSSLNEQYNLALADMAEGRYEVAKQRLEFVIAQDPSFPGVTEKMAEVLSILYATATPTPPAPTVTPTSTRDLRPVEDMFKYSQSLVAEQKWTEAIEALLTLRKEILDYQTSRVDGMLFISLRYRGVDKIWKEGNLEGGIYDLALAARFAPLDVQANSSRELARLYVIGSSFWEVLPDQAIIYFSQVAAAAPGLRDASGWTASQRYREVLIQYGDQLITKKDWCNAQQQYELALSLGTDATLQEKASHAALQCSPPTETPTITGEVPTATLPSLFTPTATSDFLPTPTNTLPANPPTNTIAAPTDTSPPPSETPVPPTATESLPPTDVYPAPAGIAPPS